MATYPELLLGRPRLVELLALAAERLLVVGKLAHLELLFARLLHKLLLDLLKDGYVVERVLVILCELGGRARDDHRREALVLVEPLLLLRLGHDDQERHQKVRVGVDDVVLPHDVRQRAHG